jgi:hypothetical protein
MQPKRKRPKRITERFTDPRPERRIDPRENQQPKKAKPSMIAYIPIPEHNPEEHPHKIHKPPRQTPPNIPEATCQYTPPKFPKANTTQHYPGHRTPPKLHKAAGTCHYPHLRFPLLRKPEIPRPREQLSRKQHNWNARKQPNN